MFGPNSYAIRRARAADATALMRLAALDSQPVPYGDLLIGEIDGVPAAAISLTDTRAIADPFKRTAALVTILHMRLEALRAFERTPSLRERVLRAIRPRPVVAYAAA
jgi:hypothetical protein